MGRIKLCLCFCLLVSILSGTVAAAGSLLPEEIRILLSLPVQQSVISLEGAGILCHSQERELIRSEGDRIRITLVRGSFWQLSGSYTSYADSLRQGESRLGTRFLWFPVFDGTWRIWLGNPDAAGIREEELLQAFPELSFTPIILSYPALNIDMGAASSWLYCAQAPLTLTRENSQSITITEKGYSYQGILEIREQQGSLQIINQVGTEHFVASSCAREMSPSWPVEALKAQAVAVRSLLAKRCAEATGTSEYLLADTNLSYSGSNLVLQGAVQQAVTATAGQVMLYDNLPIEAVYHADAGGHTQNCEDVWHTPLPYLRGVPELFPSQGPDAFWSSAPGFNASELQQLIVQAGYPDPGPVREVITEALTVSGAALSLRFRGSKGEVVLKMGEIRSVLQLKSNNLVLQSGQQQLLARSRSSLVQFEALPVFIRSGSGISSSAEKNGLVMKSAASVASIVSASGDLFIFSGSGWGHGVGLSQWGAKAMADNGYDYLAILLHYYTGVRIAE